MSRDRNPESLERLVDGLLRGQPARRAPSSLQARVLARIQAAELSAEQPWWRQSFLHWPLAARAVFLLASIGFIRLVFMGGASIAAAFKAHEVAQGVLSPALTWVRLGVELFQAFNAVLEFLARTIPTGWIYGALVLGIALYVVLFGLGTCAYRLLYVSK